MNTYMKFIQLIQNKCLKIIKKFPYIHTHVTQKTKRNYNPVTDSATRKGRSADVVKVWQWVKTISYTENKQFVLYLTFSLIQR
jgi:hypothetical protein